MILSYLATLNQFASSATGKTACPGGGPTGDSSCDTGLPVVGANGAHLHGILQLTFGILAVLAVLFVVIGGLRFVLSAGNPQEAKKARDTIIYAVVGLVIAVIAESIVTFVLNRA